MSKKKARIRYLSDQLWKCKLKKERYRRERDNYKRRWEGITRRGER